MHAKRTCSKNHLHSLWVNVRKSGLDLDSVDVTTPPVVSIEFNHFNPTPRLFKPFSFLILLVIVICWVRIINLFLPVLLHSHSTSLNIYIILIHFHTRSETFLSLGFRTSLPWDLRSERLIFLLQFNILLLLDQLPL